jgi:hypothetical protein
MFDDAKQLFALALKNNGLMLYVHASVRDQDFGCLR